MGFRTPHPAGHAPAVRHRGIQGRESAYPAAEVHPPAPSDPRGQGVQIRSGCAETALRHQRAVQHGRPYRRRDRCRTRGRVDFPLYLLVFGVPQTVRATVDQQPNGQSHPRGVAEPLAGRGVRQPLPLGQSPQRGRLGRRHQRIQALSIAAGRGVWSLGRVQTPTLAIICSRYLENKAFKPATYYQLKLSTAKDATLFAALSAQRFDDEHAAQPAYAAVIDAEQIRVVRVERKEVKEQPPLLYDLTTLQKEANTRYGFSADKTLGIAQTLYEKKHITYPRTGSRYIPEDVAAEIRPLLATLREHPQFGREAAAVAGSEINRRSVDNDKVTDHHALLITEVAPTSLPTEEQTIYDLIAGRMVEAFGGICIKEVSTARLECGGMEFVARGTVVREGGWRKVRREPEERTDDTTAALPALHEGDALPVKGCDVERKQTKPRPIHTESSLLAAM